MTPRPSRRGGEQKTDGRFAYEGLDRAIHEKARLGILTSLCGHRDGLSFNDLKELCSLTDGNLSRHLAVLSEAGLVGMDKERTTSRPQSIYRITADGRRRFLEYISVLESVVADAAANSAEPKSASNRLARGWSSA